MTPERWREIERIFHSAVELPSSARAAYLDGACAGDSALRREVESLIGNDGAPASFLAAPPVRLQPVARLSDLIDRVIDGKYRIERQLGQGGMGAVFVATHLGTKRQVAFKVIAPQFMAKEEFVERFKREAEAAGRLRHPNVVNVTDFGFGEIGTDRIAYLVMEYLAGGTLAELIKERGPLALDLTVDIIEQTALAIDEAHKQGVIHRDLKPENIWLEPTGRGGFNVKVLDFGLAKLRAAIAPSETFSTSDFSDQSYQDHSEARTLVHETSQLTANPETQQTRRERKRPSAGEFDNRTVPAWLTRVGHVMGTPLYMSPEQCHGRELDSRSDIYSLGVITYEMLAGVPPFTGEFHQLLIKHSDMSPPGLRSQRRDITLGVESCVNYALAKAPHQRPVSARAYATSLRVCAEGELPLMRAATAQYSQYFSFHFTLAAIFHVPVLVAINYLVINLPINSRYTAILAWTISLSLLMAVRILYRAAAVYAQERAARSVSLSLAPTLLATMRSLPELLKSSIMGWVTSLASLVQVKQGLAGYLSNTLIAPALMLEGLSGRAALARARALSVCLPHLTFAIRLRETLLLLLSPTIIFVMLFISTFSGLGLYQLIIRLLAALLVIVGQPVTALATLLAYRKARLIRGEEVETDDTAIAAIPTSRPMMSRTSLLAITTVIVFTVLYILRDPMLMNATVRGSALGTQIMIVAGADVNASDDSGSTVLTLALNNFNPAIYRKLLLAGADVHLVNEDLRTPLLQAAKNESPHAFAAMKELLRAGATVKTRDRFGRTPLMFACRANVHDHNKVRLLLEQGDEVNARDFENRTALMMAAAQDAGYVETVKALIAAGAELNVRDKDGLTALNEAVTYNPLHVQLLIEAGADLNIPDNAGRTPLINAFQHNSYDYQPDRAIEQRKKMAQVTAMLIKAGTDLRAKDSAGMTALEYARRHGYAEAAALIEQELNR